MTLREGISKMASEGSMKAYFRGNGANVLKIAPETAMKLTFNDLLKHVIAEDPDEITPSQRMFCGGLAGALSQGLVYPLDTVRTRLAVAPPGKYKGIWRTGVRITQEEGWRCLYRGLAPSMIGILPYAGVDIALFEIFKDFLLEEYEGDPHPVMILGAGMLSSSLAQFVSYPLALIRTRLQAQVGDPSRVKYTGMTDVLVKTLRYEGWRGLYKGLLPNLFKLAPAAGVSWFVFEETKMILGINPRS